MTGRTRRYGTLPRATLRPDRRRRRDAPGAIAAAAGSGGSLPLRSGLRLVEGLRDVLTGRLCGLPDRQATGEHLGEHRLQDVAVLDVDPVLRLRHEPAALRGPLVHATAEQVGRIRDVALLLERLFARSAGEVRDPGDRLRLRIALRRHRESRTAEEARNRLALGVARHHELLRHAGVLLAGAARVPRRPVERGRPALRIDGVGERVAGTETAGVEGRRPLGLRGVEEGLEPLQSGDRLLRVERPVPLAVRARRDRAAVVEDESERRVPVFAPDVERREPLDVLLHLPDLGELALELVQALRRLLEAGLLEHVAAESDHPRADVVRDA